MLFASTRTEHRDFPLALNMANCTLLNASLEAAMFAASPNRCHERLLFFISHAFFLGGAFGRLYILFFST
jgi:hypothetical protein